MKTITGEIYNTSFGTIIVYNEQELVFSVGETVLFCNTHFKIKRIIAPSTPNSKWSLVVVIIA